MKALAALLLLGAAPLPVSVPPAEPPPQAGSAPGEQGFAVGLGTDDATRMTVPVSIGGKGPYRFVVDTGAERTVIARELAQDLRLDVSGKARVHSMTEVSDITTVLIPTLKVGERQVRGINAPTLERQNLGAEGMLGVDSLQSQRVSFDFGRQAMTVVNAQQREEHWASDAIVVSGRSRFGHLVLVDASLDGERVWVIVDTGAQVTVGNSALRQRLARHHRLGPVVPIEMLSITGGRMTAEQGVTRTFHLGGVEIHDLPIAFADAHPFRQLGLMDRPAVLLGMDALKLFARVSVDFANRRVRLLMPGRSQSQPGTQVAALERHQLS